MGIQASSQSIREMEKNLNDTIRDMEQIAAGIKNVLNATKDWNDQQSREFRNVMDKIGKLTMQPVDQLNAAIPRLEQLAQYVDEYSRIRF